MIAQGFPQPTAPEFWVFIGCLLFLASAYLLFLKIGNERRKSQESDEPKRRLLPDPLRTESVKIYVEEHVSQQRFSQIRQEFDDKFVKHEKYVHGSIHGLREDLNEISLLAKEGREVATEQFQKIEGRLGGLQSTTEHTNALAIRTDQAVRALAADLPKEIANAVRSKRT